MQTLSRVSASPLGSMLAAIAFAAGGCSDHNPDPYQPLTEACDECLLASGADGCGDAYEACEDLVRCEPVVLCELGQQCYTEPSSGDCSRVKGCESGADMTALHAASEFEECARSVCADVCSYVE